MEFWVLLPYMPSREARIPPTMEDHRRYATIEEALSAEIPEGWEDCYLCEATGMDDLQESLAVMKRGVKRSVLAAASREKGATDLRVSVGKDGSVKVSVKASEQVLLELFDRLSVVKPRRVALR